MNKTKTSIASRYGPCVAAAACAILACPAFAGEPLELQLHWLDVRGARDIERGHYQRGVERLEARLGTGRHSPRVRVPILIDLCVGYTMLNRLEEAARACDEAAASKWYTSIALNNRGVVNVVRGRYAAAIRDFRAASRSIGASRVARHNMGQAEERFAAIRRQGQQALLAGNLDISDVSTPSVGK